MKWDEISTRHGQEQINSALGQSDLIEEPEKTMMLISPKRSSFCYIIMDNKKQNVEMRNERQKPLENVDLCYITVDLVI